MEAKSVEMIVSQRDFNALMSFKKLKSTPALFAVPCRPPASDKLSHLSDPVLQHAIKCLALSGMSTLICSPPNKKNLDAIFFS